MVTDGKQSYPGGHFAMYRNIASVCGRTEISIIMSITLQRKKEFRVFKLGRVMKDTFAFPLILFSI